MFINVREAFVNGNTYFEKVDLDRAITEFKQAIALDPDYAST